MKLMGLIPESPTRLHGLLMKMFEDRQSLRFAGVNIDAGCIDIVWQPEAAPDGVTNVYVPLKGEQLAEAQRLVEHLLSQMSLGEPASAASANDLFGMVDRRPISADVERADYDGITPADVLTTEATEDTEPTAAPRRSV